MNNKRYIWLLGVFCGVSGSLLTASEVDLSRSNKRPRRDSEGFAIPVLSPEKKQKILVRTARKKQQEFAADLEKTLDSRVHDRYTLKTALDTIDWYTVQAQANPAYYEVKTKDGKSITFLVAQHAHCLGLQSKFSCLWNQMPEHVKQREVAFQDTKTGDTLLHCLAKHEMYSIIPVASLIPQDLLRKNKEGRLAWQCSSKPSCIAIQELKKRTEQ